MNTFQSMSNLGSNCKLQGIGKKDADSILLGMMQKYQGMFDADSESYNMADYFWMGYYHPDEKIQPTDFSGLKLKDVSDTFIQDYISMFKSDMELLEQLND